MIYIASPYTLTYSLLMQAQRAAQVREFVAWCYKREWNIYSPIAHSAGLEKYDLPGNYKFWRQFAEPMIKLSDEMYVLCIDGWDVSIGIDDEIKIAGANNKRVSFWCKVDDTYVRMWANNKAEALECLGNPNFIECQRALLKGRTGQEAETQ